MKRIIKSICCLGLLSVTLACSKDDLILLENKPMFVDNGEPRNIARPEDIVVLGEVNKMIKIQWPSVSNQIETAVVLVSIKSNGMRLQTAVFGSAETVQEFIVTDFEEDFIIDLDQLQEYTIEVYYNSKNGSKSKSQFFTVTPQDYDVNLIATDFELTPMAGKIRFDFAKRLLGDYEYIIKYTSNNENYVKSFVSTQDSVDTFFIDNLGNDSFDYQFDVQIKDKSINVSTESIVKTASPLPFPAILVSRMLAVRNWLDGALVSWSNATGENVKVITSYMLNGNRVVKEKISSAAVDTIGIKGLPIGAHSITVHTEDDYGTRSSEKVLQVNIGQPYSFMTATDKQGWEVEVSSNQVGDGGGGPALIDGNNASFWHTPWSGAVPNFPHSATIIFPTSYKLTKAILRTRDNSTPNSPGQIDMQVSMNGVDFVTHQSFTNTINSRSVEVNLDLNVPVYTKYVRFIFKTSLSNTAFMNLAEISFQGYKE